MSSKTPHLARNTVRARKQDDDASRTLAAMAYGLMVLLASPAFTFVRPGIEEVKAFSPIECAAMGMLDALPPLKPVTQVLMFPAAISQRMSDMLRQCYLGHKDRCQPADLLDIAASWEAADQSELLGEVKQIVAPQHLPFLMAGGLIVTLGGLAGMVHPVRLTVIGLFMMVYAVFMTDGVQILPTLFMHSLLMGYSVFYSYIVDAANAPNGAAPSAQAAAKPQPPTSTHNKVNKTTSKPASTTRQGKGRKKA